MVKIMGGKCPFPKRSALTVDKFFTLSWLPYARARKRSWKMDSSIGIRHISPAFGAQKLQNLSVAAIESWLFSMRAAGLAASSCNRILSLLKSVLALAERQGYLAAGSAPTRQVKFLQTPQPVEKFLNVADGRRLMNYLQKSSRPEARAIQLLILTGARKSEILKAAWINFDPEHRVLNVPLSKSGRKRHIYLCEEAVRIIFSLSGKSDSLWIFPGRDPLKPVSDIYRFWNKARHDLGFDGVRLHDLRHTYASYLAAAGHSLYEIQCLLGHSNPRTTMRYAHFAGHSLLKAAANVERLLVNREN